MFGGLRTFTRALCAGVTVAAVAVTNFVAAATITAPFDSTYSITNLGPISGVPISYGGLTLLAGDPNTLLIGGEANTSSGALYTVGLVRDSNNHITGFSGPAELYASAPYNDGGIVYGPGGVLFAAQWPANLLSQYLPGSTSPDKVIDMAALGVETSLAALNFVPVGFPGEGLLKLVAYGGGEFYTATLSPDGSGTYDITAVQHETSITGGPEGFTYIPTGSPLFGTPSLLVSEYAAGSVGVYQIDAFGNPIVETRQDFITGLFGAEGAFIDPLTGDFLFSTFGSQNQVYVVQGFVAPEPPEPPVNAVPEPTSMALAGFAGLGLALRAWRRRGQAA